MTETAIIVDWGTTGFRAWLTRLADGHVLDTVTEGRGMAALAPEAFSAQCHDRLAPWRSGADVPPVYLAGMVGAVGGWHMAPQLPVPVTLDDLARNLVAVPGETETWIVPGARVQGPFPDVMRGEEVQVFGALSLAGVDGAQICLPGTHSKWVDVANRQLTGFTTAMTGEVHAVMLGHSLLGRLAEDDGGEIDDAAFDQGMAEAERPEGLLTTLFSARARVLDHSLAPHGVRSYLSGLLIASEVRAMSRRIEPGGKPLLLVSGAGLRAPYERALARAGVVARWIESGEATRAGLLEVVTTHRPTTPSGSL